MVTYILKVIGTGKAKIGFKLKIDDNPKAKGLALKEVRIDSDGGVLVLREEELEMMENMIEVGKRKRN